ncbi:MAG: hypothetical protein LLG20_18350 [Acidobacteriales bacterium]|nr:hypothetical protein [Terriglobales bacterium]
MSATISSFDGIRVEYGSTNGTSRMGRQYRDDHFFDVARIAKYPGYAVEITNIESFGYCAVVRFPAETFNQHRVVFFPSNKWFDEWLAGLNPKPEVLCQFGRVEAAEAGGTA